MALERLLPLPVDEFVGQIIHASAREELLDSIVAHAAEVAVPRGSETHNRDHALPGLVVVPVDRNLIKIRLMRDYEGFNVVDFFGRFHIALLLILSQSSQSPAPPQ